MYGNAVILTIIIVTLSGDCKIKNSYIYIKKLSLNFKYREYK